MAWPVWPARGAVWPARGAVWPARGAVSPARGAVSPAGGAVSPAGGAVSPARGAEIDIFPHEAQSLPGQCAQDATAKAGGTQVDPVNTPRTFSLARHRVRELVRERVTHPDIQTHGSV
jgi:hypothetical protein